EVGADRDDRRGEHDEEPLRAHRGEHERRELRALGGRSFDHAYEARRDPADGSSGRPPSFRLRTTYLSPTARLRGIQRRSEGGLSRLAAPDTRGRGRTTRTCVIDARWTARSTSTPRATHAHARVNKNAGLSTLVLWNPPPARSN